MEFKKSRCDDIAASNEDLLEAMTEEIIGTPRIEKLSSDSGEAQPHVRNESQLTFQMGLSELRASYNCSTSSKMVRYQS